MKTSIWFEALGISMFKNDLPYLISMNKDYSDRLTPKYIKAIEYLANISNQRRHVLLTTSEPIPCKPLTLLEKVFDKLKIKL